jgi:hypothetical protein
MIRNVRSIAIVTLLIGSAWASADGVLDLLPEEAGVAFAVRNIHDLKASADKLVKDAGLEGGDSPSKIIDQLLAFLNLGGVIDEKSSIAVMLIDPGDGTLASKTVSEDKCAVFVVPFTDLKVIAEHFGVTTKDLDDNKVCTLNKPTFLGKFAAARRKHLYFGNNDKAIQAALRGKPLAGVLTGPEKRTYTEADVVLYASPRPFGPNWTTVLDDLSKQLKDGTDREGQELADKVTEAMRTVRFSLWSAQLGGGLALNMFTLWPGDKKEAAAKFLKLFETEPGSCKPAGLPDRPAVFTQAMHGNGRQMARLARLIAGSKLFPPEVSHWLPATERPALLAIASEVYKHVQGHRLAIYRNSDDLKYGLFSGVAILETADADRFLSETKRLARLAGAVDTAGDAPDTEAEIDRLIRDLGADEYVARETATDRLFIIGERALPRLEKATTSDDPEVRRRAKELQLQISAMALERRKALVKEGPWTLRPSFTFTAPQKRGSRTIETARISLTGKDAPYSGTLRVLLGPDWNKLRLAPQGRYIVVLWGSDETLLDEALSNLEENKPGLAASKQLADFGRHTEEGRMLEMHGSLEMVVAQLHRDTLVPGKQPKAPPMSSVGMKVGSDRLRLDIWLPATEIKAIRDAVMLLK